LQFEDAAALLEHPLQPRLAFPATKNCA